ncbi:MAG: N-acetylmuramoyl-L-alanine amidase, partial [Planctomycetota bacterium]
MPVRALLTSWFCLLLLLGTVPAQGALLRKQGDLWQVTTRVSGLRGAVETLLAGPTAEQRRHGITSAIPRGTRLISLHQHAGKVQITLSAEFLPARVVHLEEAIEQITKTALRAGPYHTVLLSVQDDSGQTVRLVDLLGVTPIRGQRSGTGAPALPAAASGALAGKTIAVSPGHGYYWHSTLGWTTQRPAIDGLTEDIHTNEICMRYVIPALENMGARVISCRERGDIVHEALGDNGQGSPRYVETGGWTQVTSGGYAGGSYRVAFATTGKPTATATWTLPLAADGIYPVYVFFPAGAVTSTVADARFTVHHSGGTAQVRVDQTQDDRRWIHLGNFSFTRTAGARIVLDNQSATVGKLVIADAVRVGGGRGSIARGAGTSGKPRWQECGRYWTQFAGAPASVYNPISGGQDNSDDVTARPRYAEWRGANAYISLHTNAGGGTGTSSFIYNGGATTGSAALQSAVQTQLVKDIRAFYDSTWVDRGRRKANFGEVRLLKTMPGLLVELAFHDTKVSRDHRALHDPRFRHIAGRAYARGVMRYFNSTAPFPPNPPAGLRVTQDGKRGLLVAFEQASAGTTMYSIEQSTDGKGFVEVAQTTTTSWSTGRLPHGTMLSFRVRAHNQGGRSFPTEVLTARTSHTKRADLLLVQGFDRLDRWVKLPENTSDYLRLHGAAIRDAGEFSLGFDAASNEAVMAGRIKLQSY